MEYLEGTQIKTEIDIDKQFIDILRLRINKKMTYEAIQMEMKIAPNKISDAIKKFKNEYPRLAHLA